MKFQSLLRSELYLGRKTLLTWTVIITGLLAMFVAATSMILDNAEMVELLKNYPQALLDSFNINLESFTTFEGWMASEPYVFFVMLLSAFAIALSSTSISKEIDGRTGEFLFTTPLSRRTIFWAKAAAHFVQISLVFFIGIVVVLLLGSAITKVTNTTGLFFVLLSGYFIALASAGVGYALSSLIDNERTALSLGVGFVLLSFLFKTLAGLGGFINNLAKLSIFQLFDVLDILKTNSFTFSSLAITCGLYLLGLVVGCEILARKNLNI